MRVLHIGKVLPPPYAGIEAHIEQLLPALKPDAECELLVSEVGFKRRQTAPRQYPVRAARTLGRVASTSLSPEMPLIVRRFHRQDPGGILHVHLPNPMADLAVRGAPKAPLVVTWHSDIVRQRSLLKLYWPMLRTLLDRAERVITFTPGHLSSSTQLGYVPSHKLRIVPMGIDEVPLRQTDEVEAARRRIAPKLAGKRVVFSLGRHIYYKGYVYLVEAMQTLPKDVLLVLAGVGPLTPALRQRARELGLEDRVLFAGNVTDPEKVAWMRSCDVFCLPSIEPSEAFGIATAEAMLCGKPAVVCELGNGVNYLNRHEITGLTVPRRDPAALAAALGRLLASKALREQLGWQAQEWVRTEFSIQAMREGTLDVYREVAR
jgi:rhamnosyl/mannosyltransferase